MQIELQGHYYSTLRASDLNRDGMGLELRCDSRLVGEIFFFDASGEFIISLFEQIIPLAIIEQFITEARTDLVPIARDGL